MRLCKESKKLLFAAQNQAGNIIGLPRGAHEFIHALHQKL
jgi:hypothetical protein